MYVEFTTLGRKALTLGIYLCSSKPKDRKEGGRKEVHFISVCTCVRVKQDGMDWVY